MQITFEESKVSGYHDRTLKNASADATIAIAINFESPGEKLTKKSVKEQNKKYIAIDAKNLSVTSDRIDRIVSMLNSVSAKTLNLAGNGIFTMKGALSQDECDKFTLELLRYVLNHKDLVNKIELIRTGGQTGFDEAGTKAAIKLEIPALVFLPRGWLFRGLDGKDISDEKLFKQRFGISEPIVQTESTLQREYTSDPVTKLEPYETFVYGSNGKGAHSKGAALLAKKQFGAIQGQAEGLQGQSYAIITKKDWRVPRSSTLSEIGKGIQTMLLFANDNQDKRFLVTKIGSSLAGYSISEIKGLFFKLKNWIPKNVILPIEYEVRD